MGGTNLARLYGDWRKICGIVRCTDSAENLICHTSSNQNNFQGQPRPPPYTNRSRKKAENRLNTDASPPNSKGHLHRYLQKKPTTRIPLKTWLTFYQTSFNSC